MTLGRTAKIAILLIGCAAGSFATPETSLVDAAESGQADTVRALIEAGADVNATQVDGTTALHWAVYNDDEETARLLVKAGADVNALNQYGMPALSLACTNRNAELATTLLDAGADANFTLPGGETILMTAARTGNVEIVEALLAKGADPNATERASQTAMMWAASEGHAPVVQALLDAGVDMTASLKSGFTPFFFAVREGHNDVVRTLLKAGIDVNATMNRTARPSFTSAKAGTSPLLLSIENGHYELAVALLEAGADPNDERTGYTPLHTITWVRKPKNSDYGSDPTPEGSGNLSSLQFVRTLVSMGANVNARLKNGRHVAPKINTQGCTPFLFAADKGDIPLMKLLLELGADPYIPNVEGTTTLMAAVGQGTGAPLEDAGTEEEALEAAKMLLELGADINAVDDNGETVMHGAVYGSFPSVIQFLADSGADSKLWRKTNKHGWTPLFIAEGNRPGNFKPLSAAIQAVTKLMVAEGISTDGPRPRHIDLYEKARLAKQSP